MEIRYHSWDTLAIALALVFQFYGQQLNAGKAFGMSRGTALMRHRLASPDLEAVASVMRPSRQTTRTLEKRSAPAGGAEGTRCVGKSIQVLWSQKSI